MGISKTKLSLILIFFLGILCYANSLFNEFTYDDAMVLTGNHFVRDIKNLPRLFTSDYFLVSKERTFRPVAPAVLILEYSLFKYNPLGYHAINFLLHLANAVLLFVLLIRISIAEPVALIASLIFLIHPAVSETIFCVSYMEDLWGLLFYFAALLFFLQYYANRNPVFLLFCHLSFFISLLCKEMGITLIAVLPLLLYFYRNEKLFCRLNLLKFYVPSLLVSALYLYMRFFLFFNQEKSASYPEGGFLVTVYNIPRILVHYIKLMFYPLNLTADYQFKVYDVPFRLPVLLSSCVAVLLVLSVFKLKKDWPFWISYFLINFLPVSGIIPFGAQVAERYIYFSSAGFAVFAGLILMRVTRKYRLRQILILIIISCFQVLLIMRATDWSSNETLWRATQKRSPKSISNKAELHVHLGNIHYKKGELDLALKEYLEARRMNPRLVGCYNNIGVIYMEKGYYELAKREFVQAISMNEKATDAYFSLASLYLKTGELDKSEQLMQKAIEINPGCAVGAYNNLYYAALQRNQTDKAIGYLHKILDIDPKNENAYVNIASAYNSIGLKDKAELTLNRGVDRIPDSIIIRSALGDLYYICKQYDKSIAVLTDAIKRDPSFAKAYVSRASVFYALNKWDNAKLDLETALRLNPNQPEVLNNLGVIYAQEGNIDRAKSLWRKSLAINPDQPKITEYLEK